MTDSANVTTLHRRPKKRLSTNPNAVAARDYRARKKAQRDDATISVMSSGNDAAPAAALTPASEPSHHDASYDGVSVIALLGAVGLAAVDVYLGVTGMQAIYPSSAIAVTVMTAVIETAKLASVAWLARHWRDSHRILRSALVLAVLTMMTLSALSSAAFLIRAHLDHLAQAREAIDGEAEPIVEKIKIAESDLRDIEGRIVLRDAMVKEATTRGYIKSAATLVSEQEHARAELVAQRTTAASRLGDLRVQLATVEARRAQVTAEVGPALAIAELLGWSDGEAAVKLITMLLVMVIDPAAVLLTLAASHRRSAEP